MKLSMTMIVRNEAQTLARCLNSVRPYIDELIIVDTGSTDATKMIARQFTDHIFDFVWIDDFGAARQYALEQATGDWVAWIDADDVLIGGAYLRDELEALPGDVTAVYWRYALFDSTGQKKISEFWRERCVRRDGTYRWKGRVHENLVRNRAEQTVQSHRVSVEHHQKQRSDRSRRNLNILKAEYRALGDAVEPRTLFYLGNEYRDHGEWEAAVVTYRHYLQRGLWRDERYFAAIRLARSLWCLGQNDEAINAYLSAFKELPAFPHAYFGLAEVYYTLKEWEKVIHWVELGQQMPPPITTLFLVPRDYTYSWIIHYTNALYHIGRLYDALAWTETALALEPEDHFHRSNRAFFVEQIHARLLKQNQHISSV